MSITIYINNFIRNYENLIFFKLSQYVLLKLFYKTYHINKTVIILNFYILNQDFREDGMKYLFGHVHAPVLK